MTRFEWLTIITTFIAVLLIPALGLLVRMTVRWTRTEDKLNGLIEDMHHLVEAKEKVHEEMYRQMREDRGSTDRRLRWLEENLWHRGKPQ